MIEVARKNAGEAGVASQLHFEEGDANKLCFEDNSYNMVVSTGVFHSWRRPIRAIDEIHRVLRPGGIAVIYDPSLIFTDSREFLRHCLNWRNRFTFMWAALTYLLTYPMRSSAESVQALLSRTRFQDGEVDEKDYSFLEGCQGN